MNNLLIRLTDRETVGDTSLPGAQHIPEENPKESRLRDLLGLRSQHSPFSALAIIRAIDAYSYIRSMIPEDVRTYDTLMTQVPLFSVSGDADIVPDAKGRVGVFREATEWPLSTDIIVKEQSTNKVRVQLNKVGDAVFSKAEDSQGRWIVDWPAWSGVTGVLDPDGQTQVTITHRPVAVPFDLIRKRIKDSGWASFELISEAGLLELFNKTSIDSEAVAAAAISLAQHNNDILFAS